MIERPVLTDGVLINNSGTVTAVIYGRGPGAEIPHGETFVPMSTVVGIEPGTTPPDPVQQQLAATDYQMARGAEDAIAALIQGTIVPRVTFSATLLGRINARRVLRNQGTI